MELSCGLLIDTNGEFLCCHSTGKKWQPNTYDLPKGHLEEGENPLETAIRECREETGIDYSDRPKSDFIDLGTFSYIPKKDLHLFYVKDDDLKDTTGLHCDSTFERYGKDWPEVNGYNKFTREDMSLLYDHLQKTVREAFDKLDEIVNM